MKRYIFLLSGLVLEILLLYRLYLNQYSGMLPIIFLMSSFLFMFFFWISSPKIKLPNKKELINDFLTIFFFSLIFFIINRIDLDNWYYTSIGDEHAFWDFAKRTANGNTVNLFSQNGVYGLIPTASSFYQATIMKIIGINYLGWKTSLIIIVIASFWPFYFLIKNIFDRKTATISLAILTFSHYLWGYVHTGYSNIETLFSTISSIFLVKIGIEKNNSFLLFLGGFFAGLGFYTFYPSRLSILLILILVVLTIKKEKIAYVSLTIIIGFLLSFLPILATSKMEVFKAMFSRSLTNPYPKTNESMLYHFFSNMKISILAFVYNTHEGPYVTGSLIDPISGVFLLIGIFLSIFKANKFPWSYLLIWFFIAITVTGGLSQYHLSTVSRLNYVMPVIAVFVAIGIRKTKEIITYFLLILILLLNIYRFKFQTPKNFPASKEALSIAATRSIYCRNKSSAPVIFVRNSLSSPLNGALDSLKPYKYPLLLNYTDFPKFEQAYQNNDSCYIFVHQEDKESQEIITKTMNGSRPKNQKNLYDTSKKTSVVILY